MAQNSKRSILWFKIMWHCLLRWLFEPSLGPLVGRKVEWKPNFSATISTEHLNVFVIKVIEMWMAMVEIASLLTRNRFKISALIGWNDQPIRIIFKCHISVNYSMNFLNEEVLVQSTQVVFQLHRENGNAFAILDTMEIIIMLMIRITNPTVLTSMNVLLEHSMQMGRIDLM